MKIQTRPPFGLQDEFAAVFTVCSSGARTSKKSVPSE